MPKALVTGGTGFVGGHVALEIGAATTPGRRALVVLDEWVETLPAALRADQPVGVPEESAAVAFRFDRPDARAPQALLVAVPPDIERGWRLEDLHAIVDETLWWAMARPLDADDLPELRWVLP